jgi:hypothetical protein
MIAGRNATRVDYGMYSTADLMNFKEGLLPAIPLSLPVHILRNFLLASVNDMPSLIASAIFSSAST